MPHLIALVLTMVSALAGAHSFILAYDWIHIGHGLNPFIAIPLGCFMFVAPIVVFRYWVEMFSLLLGTEPDRDNV